MNITLDEFVLLVRWRALPHCVRIARMPFVAGAYWAAAEIVYEGLG